jgi:hypothetical protein
VQLTTTQVSLIADLISLVCEEHKQDRDPWWRRTRRAA